MRRLCGLLIVLICTLASAAFAQLPLLDNLSRDPTDDQAYGELPWDSLDKTSFPPPCIAGYCVMGFDTVSGMFDCGPCSSGGGGGTECSTSPCDLDAATTQDGKGICLDDWTNCPPTATPVLTATPYTTPTPYLTSTPYPTPTVVLTTTSTPVICHTVGTAVGFLGGLFKANPDECLGTPQPTSTATPTTPPATATYTIPFATPTPQLTAAAAPCTCRTAASVLGPRGGMYGDNPCLCLPTPDPTATVTSTAAVTTPTYTVPFATPTTDGTPLPVGQRTTEAGNVGYHAHAVDVPFNIATDATSTPTPVFTTTPTGTTPTPTATATGTAATPTPIPALNVTGQIRQLAVEPNTPNLLSSRTIIGKPTTPFAWLQVVPEIDDGEYRNGVIAYGFYADLVPQLKQTTPSRDWIAGHASTRYTGTYSIPNQGFGIFGMEVIAAHNGPGATIARVIGDDIKAFCGASTTNNSGSPTCTRLQGGLYQATVTAASGGATHVAGVASQANVTGGTTATNVASGRFVYGLSNASAVATNLFGLWVTPVDNTLNLNIMTAGTATNFYGLRVDDPGTSVTFTNRPIGVYLQKFSATGAVGLKNDGRTVETPDTAQAITAVGNTIAIDTTTHQITADASYTLTSTPTLADGEDGQRVLIINVDAGADVVTIQDQGTLAGSNLRLGANTRALGPRDSIMLMYSSTIGDWIEIAFTNVL